MTRFSVDERALGAVVEHDFPEGFELFTAESPRLLGPNLHELVAKLVRDGAIAAEAGEQELVCLPCGAGGGDEGWALEEHAPEHDQVLVGYRRGARIVGEIRAARELAAPPGEDIPVEGDRALLERLAHGVVEIANRSGARPADRPRIADGELA